MLELGKALSFFCSLLALFWTAVGAFTWPGTHWEDRAWLGLFRLLFAAAVCLSSGVLFRWPVRTNPDAGQPLASTLPMRLFFWGASGIVLLFLASWYLICGAPCLQTTRLCPCVV
jgi:hypothetical protein